MGEFRYIYSEELYHHGILGQKWGVRRFQNKDGSLTSSGRKRRGLSGTIKQIKKNYKRKKTLAKARKAREENKKKQEELEKLKAEYRKSPKSLLDHQELFTDEEIKAANARFKLLNDTKAERLNSINRYADTGKKIFDSINSAAVIGKTLSEIYKNLPHEDTSEVGKLKREAEKTKAEGDIQRNKNALLQAKETEKKLLAKGKDEEDQKTDKGKNPLKNLLSKPKADSAKKDKPPKDDSAKKDKPPKSKEKSNRSAWDDIRDSMMDRRFAPLSESPRTTKLPKAPETTLLKQNRTKDITSDEIRSSISKYGMTKYNDIGRYVGNDNTDKTLRDFMGNAHSMSVSEINDWLKSH